MSVSLDLGGLSDRELQDLILQSRSVDGRILAMWFLLKDRREMTLEAMDSILRSLAEKELRRRSISRENEFMEYHVPQ